MQGYLIYQNDVGLVGNTSNHKFTVTALRSMTKYTFTLRPYNSAGVGPPYNIEVTTTGMVTNGKREKKGEMKCRERPKKKKVFFAPDQ